MEKRRGITGIFPFQALVFVVDFRYYIGQYTPRTGTIRVPRIPWKCYMYFTR